MHDQELPFYHCDIHHRPIGAPRIYKIIEKDYAIAYIKDGKFHNEKGPAIVYIGGRKRYFLNNVELGANEIDRPDDIQYIPSDEYWIKFCKLKVFQ